jgi:hypothetical protein
VWAHRVDDVVTVYLPIEGFTNLRAPVLVITADRQSGEITARIGLRDDVVDGLSMES